MPNQNDNFILNMFGLNKKRTVKKIVKGIQCYYWKRCYLLITCLLFLNIEYFFLEYESFFHIVIP